MSTTVHDDYLDCGAYQAHISNKSAAHPGFITFQEANGDHFFAWVDGDNIVLRSEAYPNEEKVERGIAAILKNCDIAERYEVIEENGKYILVLWGGGNHQVHTGNMEQHNEIGRSCPHNSREDLNKLLQFKGADFANSVVPIDGAGNGVAATAAATGVASAVSATTDIGAGTIAAAGAATAAVASALSNVTDNASSAASDASQKGTETLAAASSTASGYAGDASAAAGAATSYATDAAAAATGGSFGWLKWLLPLLLLGGLFFWWKTCNDKDAASTAANPSTPSTNAVTTTGTTVVSNTESLKVKLADGVEIEAFKGGIEDKLVTFLNDKASTLADSADKKKYWFDFNDLNFDFNKTTITKESYKQIKNLVAIMKAYPNLKFKIGAYTDKKGDDNYNMKLSQGRADEVLAAIKKEGGDVSRIAKAEGYGETLATVAETATDAERLVDRRTAIRILAK